MSSANLIWPVITTAIEKPSVITTLQPPPIFIDDQITNGPPYSKKKLKPKKRSATREKETQNPKIR